MKSSPKFAAQLSPTANIPKLLSIDDAKGIAGNMAGILAATLSSTIELCDKQYVKLESILTRSWMNIFME